MVKIKKKLTTKNCYKGRNNPKYIVIHETDNYSKGAGAERHATALNNGNLSTSVHYFVDDKVIYQVLDHKNGAWAVGKDYGKKTVPDATNMNTINIEICVNPDSNYDKARKNCIDLVKKLMKDTGIPASRIIRHYDAKGKYCPRKMLDTPSLWKDFVKQISGGAAPSSGDTSKPNTSTSKKPSTSLAKKPAAAYVIGNEYTLQSNMNVRTGPGTGYSKKKRSQLTADGKKHAKLGYHAVLKKGTRVTVKEVRTVGQSVWLRIPSGWVCARDSKKTYVK